MAVLPFAMRIITMLIFIANCGAFQSTLRAKSYRSFALNAREVVIFGPNNMRIHDNPCLLSTDGKPIIPVIFARSNGDKNLHEAAKSLKSKLQQLGGNPVELTSDQSTAVEEFSLFIQSLRDETEMADNSISITYCKSAVEPNVSSINQLIGHVSATNSNVQCIGIWDEIVQLDEGEVISPNLHFDEFSEQYKHYSLVVPKPVMQPKIVFDAKFATSSVAVGSPSNICSEDRALELLSEYLSIGDKAFSYKYASTYASMFSNSKSHTESITRLSTVVSDSDTKDSTNTNFFQGEVISAVLAPMMTIGCLSPRLLMHAKRTLLGEKKAASPEFPFKNRIREEAVRRDWHQQLARAGLPVPSPLNQLTQNGGWHTKYQNWRGYIQREGVMKTAADLAAPSTVKKPLAFVLHGFGGSLDQFTGFARELSEEYTVISFDSLGFGYSEKPPLSYNQYLWRDQVVDFVLRECEERGATGVTLMGNSIGGFTVASVAAALSVLQQQGKSIVKCEGLVLMNSAGNIIAGAGLTDTPFMQLFPAYKGPPSEALRAFGTVMFSILQPRIEQMLVWLYPANSSMVKLGLAGGILRDSQDPGASDVIAAGGKLPTPRPMNDLFREYTGPVLIAQGALDPLNDAKGRAKTFEDIRAGVTVDLMPLGHCPMDENPKMVAASVITWAQREGLLSSKTAASPSPNPALLAV